jgi:hypothetical protein
VNFDTEPDRFYRAFIVRNKGLVPGKVQDALRTARILVAGCGSTGGAVIEPLARLGAEHFILAEPGEYELSNLNRQSASHADVGKNKAEVAARRIRAINPHAVADVHAGGVSSANAEVLAKEADIVIDGVDVTTAAGWRAKYLVHAAAARFGRPVISGYDMSGTQYVRYYDYRDTKAPLAGQVTEADIEGGKLWDLLLKIVPREVVPADLIADIRANRGDPEYSVPQLSYTSQLFGVLASRYVVEVLAGHPVRDEITVDVHQLITI